VPARKQQGRRPRPALPKRRSEPVSRVSGNGHDRKTYGPGHMARQDAAERRPQPRH
jgi:hypothetical protein